MNLARIDEITLLRRSFMVVNPALLVDTSPWYSSLSAPTVILVFSFSSFCGLKSQKNHAYMTFLLYRTSCFWMNFMVYVPWIPLFKPFISLPNFLVDDFSHTYLVAGSGMRCLYSIMFPVTGLMMELMYCCVALSDKL